MIAFIGLGITLVGILFIWRRARVGNYRCRVLDRAWGLIGSGKLQEARYLITQFKRVSDGEMLWKFWRGLDSFFPEKVVPIKTEEKIKMLAEEVSLQVAPAVVYNIIKLGGKYGWEHVDTQKNPPVVSFRRKGVRVNVYYTKMTVGTCLDHPTKKKTQLFRKNVSMGQLEKIFDNPRVHTGKGYYKK